VRGFVESTNAQHGSSSSIASLSSSSGTEASTSSAAEYQDANPPPAKRSKLFDSYTRKSSLLQPPTDTASQIRKYLDSNFDSSNFTDALSFWNSDSIANEYHQLYNAANRVLSVPASSAAIERVFSQGGLIAVPHRASMTDKTLSSLLFLKCNFNLK
jgi:hAT family C-terminal dimerisation region